MLFMVIIFRNDKMKLIVGFGRPQRKMDGFGDEGAAPTLNAELTKNGGLKWAFS